MASTPYAIRWPAIATSWISNPEDGTRVWEESAKMVAITVKAGRNHGSL